MIYPQKNIFLKTVFNAYVRWLTAWHFHQINYNDIKIDANKSILLIANHFSAWDTFVLYHLNRLLFRKKFHAMILEQTMLKEPMLKYAGGFSVNKSSRDIVASLDFAAKLLNDPDNLVLIYPQGKLYSNMVTSIIFEQGVIRVIKKAAGKFSLVYAATFIENFENYKSLANVQLKTESIDNFSDIEQLQQAYQQHYTQALQQQIQITRQ